MSERTERAKVRNIIVVSDTHVGCRMGLCHPDGAALDGGGTPATTTPDGAATTEER